MPHNRRCLLLIILLVMTAILIPGCSDNQTSDPESNPKLGSYLGRLILAEEPGEAEEFARQRGIELVDGAVRVIIECDSGQAGIVATAAGSLGNVELTVRDLVQVVVPISNLNAMTDIPGVRLVRLPWYPVEED